MTKYLFLATTAAAMMVGCAGQTNTGTGAVEKAIPVKVMTLDTRHVNRSVDYTASLEADEQVYYAPASPGRIERILVEVGDRVKAGQVLVEMDKTQLAQAEVQLQNLETEFKRAAALLETNSISRQAYDGVVTQRDVALTNVRFLRENTRLLSPFDGVITGRYFEAGEMFSGSPAGGAAKASIVRVERIDPLKALVNMTEEHFPVMRAGIPVELRAAVYPGRVYAGKVSIVYPTIDKGSRTFTVEVQLPNGDRSLRPGMFGTINFLVGSADAIIVPALSVLKLQGSNLRYVFLNEKGRARRVEVTLGKRFEDQVEIISDKIKGGDQLVCVGQARLVDGSLLEITR
ncbi:MAG: efflux RND transporter periplasmic adaptor subunit [Odoribacteraceae bacterium]|jgi:RND family efflux transporter MFP subunit|nr:efflux RND transporter periplasmic adaptor subunit [Odoribacteraceae bacterium]